MKKEGNNYFTCQVTEHIDSCKHCKARDKDDQKRCKYCEDYDCFYTQWKRCGKHSCRKHEQRVKTMSQPCPPDYSQRGSQPDSKCSWPNSVDWSLNVDKEEEFWTAIESAVGVEWGAYRWEDKHDKEGVFRHGVRHEEEKHLFWDRNYPKASGFGESSVVDPSTFIDKATKNITDMMTGIERLLTDIRAGKPVPDLSDIVDALEIPVLAVETAVQSMEEIYEIGTKVDEQQLIDNVLTALGVILFVVPLAGQALGAAAGMAAMTRVMFAMAVAADLATSIYEVVITEGQEMEAILLLVFSMAGVFDLARMSKAARLRRSFRGKTFEVVGSKTKARADEIHSIRNPPSTCPLRFNGPLHGFGEPMLGSNGTDVADRVDDYKDYEYAW
jgi:hypothetical protein